MNISTDLTNAGVQVFAISPRREGAAWTDIQRVVNFSDRFGLSGVLAFAGHDTTVEPFVVASTILQGSGSLIPLVAVNPIYMHPFTVAKLVSSFAHIHKRPIYLNLVSGASTRFLQSFNDTLTHDERYLRLTEYGKILELLLAGDGLTNFSGKYYAVSALQLSPRIPAELKPRLMVAGESESARRTAAELGAVGMRMLTAELDRAIDPDASGVHFGLIARSNKVSAFKAASEQFPAAPDESALAAAMTYTDSHWKMRLKNFSDERPADVEGFWMGPFKSGRADCPYLVGAVDWAAAIVARLIDKGVRWFILDIQPNEEDFAHCAEVFRLAAQNAGRTRAVSK